MGNENEVETLDIDFSNMSKSDEEYLTKRIFEKLGEVAHLIVSDSPFHLETSFNRYIKAKSQLYRIMDFYDTQYLGRIYIIGGFIYLETREGFNYPLFKIMSRKERKIKINKGE